MHGQWSRFRAIVGACVVACLAGATAGQCPEHRVRRVAQEAAKPRPRSEVERLCFRLAETTDILDAYDLLDALDALPDREQTIKDAMGLLGRVNFRLDWWLFSHAGMGLGTNESWNVALADELSSRPELLTAFLHVMRYEWMMHSTDNVANLHFELLAGTTKDDPSIWEQYYAADEADRSQQTDDVMRLQLAWAVCGHPEQARGLNRKNWPERYRQWAKWWKFYGPYLRFDEKRGYMVMDSKARQSGKALPDEVRRIPWTETPHPEWSGPQPHFPDFEQLKDRIVDPTTKPPPARRRDRSSPN